MEVVVDNVVARPGKEFWSAAVEQWEAQMRVNEITINPCSRVLSQGVVRRKSRNIIMRALFNVNGGLWLRVFGVFFSVCMGQVTKDLEKSIISIPGNSCGVSKSVAAI